MAEDWDIQVGGPGMTLAEAGAAYPEQRAMSLAMLRKTTLEATSKVTGIPESTIFDYELGRAFPTREHLVVLATAYGALPGVLLEFFGYK